MTLAEIVPSDDLHEVRFNGQGFLPSVVPQTIAAPNPGFAVGGKIGVEPG